MKLLGGKYEIENDAVSFVVTHWVDGTDKDGNFKKQPQRSYHSTFKQCLYKILDLEGKNCPDVATLLKRYNELEKLIKTKF